MSAEDALAEIRRLLDDTARFPDKNSESRLLDEIRKVTVAVDS